MAFQRNSWYSLVDLLCRRSAICIMHRLGWELLHPNLQEIGKGQRGTTKLGLWQIMSKIVMTPIMYFEVRLSVMCKQAMDIVMFRRDLLENIVPPAFTAIP